MGVDTVIIAPVSGQDAVIPYRGYQSLYIFGDDLMPALDQGEGLAGHGQVHGATG